MNKKIIAIGGILLLYIVSTASSFAVFNFIKTPAKITTLETPQGTQVSGEDGFVVDPNAPKTEECPINGQMRTKKEKDLWEKRRPLGIMVENHEDARPQSGLTNADIVYEAVAEGGITRFLAVYYCVGSDTIVGPVRSARTYFVDFISEYADRPLYAHVGGANSSGPADALGQIEDYGWVSKNDLNQFSIGFPAYWRDYERLGHTVATEHTVYSTTNKLWTIGENRGYTNVDSKGNKWDETFIPWKFKDDALEKDRPANFSAAFDFWQGYKAYSVKWSYDPKTNIYSRFNGGAPHLDKDNNKQLTAKTIILSLMDEENANDGYENNVHLVYGDKGTGKAVILQDGIKTVGTWSKKSRVSRMKFFDETGKEISLNRGKIWIEILPTGTKVSYQ